MVIVSYQFNAGGAVLEVIVGDRAPQRVAVGDLLSRDQLTQGRLRYRCESDQRGVVHLSVRSESEIAGET